MATLLACGYEPGPPSPRVVLSHGSAAALLGIGAERDGRVEVSIRAASDCRHPGITVHRRSGLRDEDVGFYDGIPVTSPAQTILA